MGIEELVPLQRKLCPLEQKQGALLLMLASGGTYLSRYLQQAYAVLAEAPVDQLHCCLVGDSGYKVFEQDFCGLCYESITSKAPAKHGLPGIQSKVQEHDS